jgi:hypothetical protein
VVNYPITLQVVLDVMQTRPVTIYRLSNCRLVLMTYVSSSVLRRDYVDVASHLLTIFALTMRKYHSVYFAFIFHTVSPQSHNLIYRNSHCSWCAALCFWPAHVTAQVIRGRLMCVFFFHLFLNSFLVNTLQDSNIRIAFTTWYSVHNKNT